MLKALIDVQRWSRKCDGRHCLPGITLQLKTQTVNRDNIPQVAGYLRATKKSKAGKGVGEGMARDGLEGLRKYRLCRNLKDRQEQAIQVPGQDWTRRGPQCKGLRLHCS